MNHTNRRAASGPSYAYKEPVERALIGLANRQAFVRRKGDPTLGLPWLLTTFPLDPVKPSHDAIRQVKEEALSRSATPLAKVEEAIQVRWARLGIHPNGWTIAPTSNSWKSSWRPPGVCIGCLCQEI